MSSNTFQPSLWMKEAFEEDAAEVATILIQAASTAQADGSEAKAGSRLTTDDAYGVTARLAFANETVTGLEEIGAEIVHPRGSRHSVGVVNGTLILAIKLPANNKGVDDIKMKSAVRRRMLDLAPVREHTTLDFGADYELTSSDGRVVNTTEFGTATRAVLIALKGSARSGVEHLYIGDVRLSDSGEVIWLHREELPIDMTETTVAGLVALDLKPQDGSFASGALPKASLGLVTNDETVTDNDIADERTDSTDMKTAVNDESSKNSR
ncbi:hypothetical protein M2390_003013 [Mycetocola sp. BIGb0189]|uniref:hypothetical protein n=1 Tax=Mycetocola sp. BIGb0189 TaxID=2940604 RepID=UPI002166DC44|nr:hypothetical protein [Mycetocola sp. BIGb0189]MCS4277798.1 hypothetical protein [Mycetocola sp. BIGb0189]